MLSVRFIAQTTKTATQKKPHTNKNRIPKSLNFTNKYVTAYQTHTQTSYSSVTVVVVAATPATATKALFAQNRFQLTMSRAFEFHLMYGNIHSNASLCFQPTSIQFFFGFIVMPKILANMKNLQNQTHTHTHRHTHVPVQRARFARLFNFIVVGAF